jgi:hypothetical protein
MHLPCGTVTVVVHGLLTSLPTTQSLLVVQLSCSMDDRMVAGMMVWLLEAILMSC